MAKIQDNALVPDPAVGRNISTLKTKPVLPVQASAKAVVAAAKPKPTFRYGMQKKANMNPGKFSNGVGVGP